MRQPLNAMHRHADGEREGEGQRRRVGKMRNKIPFRPKAAVSLELPSVAIDRSTIAVHGSDEQLVAVVPPSSRVCLAVGILNTDRPKCMRLRTRPLTRSMSLLVCGGVRVKVAERWLAHLPFRPSPSVFAPFRKFVCASSTPITLTQASTSFGKFDSHMRGCRREGSGAKNNRNGLKR